MANTAKATAQNTRSPLLAAVAAFKQVIGDTLLVQSGQFIWATHYRNELRALVVQTIGSDPNLTKFWLTPGPPNGNMFLDDMLAVTIAPIQVARKPGDADSRKDLKAMALTALADPSMQGSSQAVATLRQLLNDPGNGGPPAYFQATIQIGQGTRVLRGTAEFQKIFPPSQNITQGIGIYSFLGALRISQTSQDKCFNTVNAVCDFVANHHPLSTKAAKATVAAKDQPGQIFLQEPKGSPQGLTAGIRRFKAPLQDLLLFSPQLPSAIDRCKAALDAGHLLNAGVVSGSLANNPTSSPDHFLLLLAWERRNTPFPHTVFAFWDPDASVTGDLEPAFGRLFFLDGKAAQQAANGSRNLGIQADIPRADGTQPVPSPGPADSRVPPYSANFYAPGGRLTTALFDTELRVTSGGNFRLATTQPPTQGRDPSPRQRTVPPTTIRDHRYQVTNIEARPGATFRK